MLHRLPIRYFQGRINACRLWTGGNGETGTINFIMLETRCQCALLNSRFRSGRSINFFRMANDNGNVERNEDVTSSA